MIDLSNLPTCHLFGCVLYLEGVELLDDRVVLGHDDDLQKAEERPSERSANGN